MDVSIAPTASGRDSLSRAVEWLSRYAVYALIVGALAYSAVFLPALFGSANLGTIGLQAAVLGIVALGQMLVLLVRGLDLSVGAVMALGAVLIVDTGAGRPLAISVALAIGIAVLIGAANGSLVVMRHVPPFVATLGMLIFVEGVRLAYTRGQASGAVPEFLRSLAVDGIGPVRWSLMIWILVSVVLYVLLAHTRFGRAVYATGSNPSAARLAGLPVGRVVVAMFIGSSLLALLTGVVLSGYIGYVDQHLGAGYNLNSITAAVIGGTSFSGGTGGVIGTGAGVILVTLLVNIVVVAGLPVEMQFVVEGVVLIAAVALQGFRLYLARS